MKYPGIVGILGNIQVLVWCFRPCRIFRTSKDSECSKAGKKGFVLCFMFGYGDHHNFKISMKTDL